MQSKSRTQNFFEFVCLINVLCLRSHLLISVIILLPHHLSLSLSSGIKQQASLIVKIFTVISFFIFVYFWRFWLFAQLWHAFSSFRPCLGRGNRIKWKWMKRIIIKYYSLLLFGSFNGRNGMSRREHSFLSISLKSQIFILPKIGRNGREWS